MLPGRPGQGRRGDLGLFKLALTTRLRGVRSAHPITGAPAVLRPSAMCADLFDGGTFATEELCRRRFPRGLRRTAWDDLPSGGHDRHPERVPAFIKTRSTHEPVELRGPGGVWQLRAVHIKPADGTDDIPFTGGWPNGARPADARDPSIH